MAKQKITKAPNERVLSVSYLLGNRVEAPLKEASKFIEWYVDVLCRSFFVGRVPWYDSGVRKLYASAYAERGNKEEPDLSFVTTLLEAGYAIRKRTSRVSSVLFTAPDFLQGYAHVYDGARLPEIRHPEVYEVRLVSGEAAIGKHFLGIYPGNVGQLDADYELVYLDLHMYRNLLTMLKNAYDRGKPLTLYYRTGGKNAKMQVVYGSVFEVDLITGQLVAEDTMGVIRLVDLRKIAQYDI